MKHFCIAALLVISFQAEAQQVNSCLQDILNYEAALYNNADSILEEKNIFLSYTVKVTDWEDVSNISNVKIYKHKKETRFFSEQVNMYTNEKEMLVEMPIQKVIAVNNALPEGKNKNKIDLTQELRKEFLESCDVVQCEASGKTTKVLVLRINPKQKVSGLQITEMRYEYDTDLKKVLSVRTNYSSEYKLKEMLVIYNAFTTESDYKFSSFKGQFLDKKGKLTAHYRDYELVDNRDKKNGSTKPR